MTTTTPCPTTCWRPSRPAGAEPRARWRRIVPVAPDSAGTVAQDADSARRWGGSRQNGWVCWKRTGSLVKMSVPSSLFPGVVTTATARVPDGCTERLGDLRRAEVARVPGDAHALLLRDVVGQPVVEPWCHVAQAAQGVLAHALQVAVTSRPPWPPSAGPGSRTRPSYRSPSGRSSTTPGAWPPGRARRRGRRRWSRVRVMRHPPRGSACRHRARPRPHCSGPRGSSARGVPAGRADR